MVSLPGTVAVGTHLFIAAEHPASAASVTKHRFDFQVPLPADVPEATLAVGPLIQEATYRAFRRYVAASRSRPEQPFLHYNSWYDIGYDGKSYDEAESQQVIHAITKKLARDPSAAIEGTVDRACHGPAIACPPGRTAPPDPGPARSAGV